MPQLSDLNTPLSGYRHIDPLLNSSPDWNFFRPAVANTLFYSFALPASVSSDSVTGVTTFSEAQKSNARVAILELTRFTGIKFAETPDPGQAQIVLLNANITQSQTTGLASWTFGWEDLPGGEFSDYFAQGTLYLDNVEFAVPNSNLSAGSRGYETLLHELGHLIGLKHPHETTPDNPTQLPAGHDDTAYTLMSYNSESRPGLTFAPYDIAALRWLYGGDGLGGLRGATPGSGMYLTGTPAADTLLGSMHSDMFDGGAGNDVIDGGDGIDFVQLNVTRNLVTLARNGDGFSLGDGGSIDQLINVERVLYTGGAVALDLDGAGGQAYRIYNAAFDRAPDARGLGFWIAQLDKGVALSAVAGAFLGSEEFVSKYGANMAHQSFVETLYLNILDRAGDQEGINFWVGNLNAGSTDQSTVLAHFSESLENVDNVAPLIGNGIHYIAYG